MAQMRMTFGEDEIRKILAEEANNAISGGGAWAPVTEDMVAFDTDGDGNVVGAYVDLVEKGNKK